MPDKDAGQSLLKMAYNLATPEDSKHYYDAFAATYDSDFSDGLGYSFPSAIAAAYKSAALKGDSPIADIGCGTGLIAEALNVPPDILDGMDISPEMLSVSRGKHLYRSLFKVDLTTSLDEIAHDYGAVLSAGTFTLGHLGPEPLKALLQIARPGGLFVIGVNKVHFKDKGFDPLLRGLDSRGLIGSLRIGEAPIYSKGGHDHSEDSALILTYRKV